MVQINLNFIASAFMLLSLQDSLAAWSRMGWYTPILAALAMAFFNLGGRKALRNGLKGQAKGGEAKKPEVRVAPPSPPNDEKDPKDLKWIKHALDNPDYQDAGQGVHPDGGLIDELAKGMETPKEEYEEAKDD
jgi:lysophospholipid acyltransferase